MNLGGSIKFNKCGVLLVLLAFILLVYYLKRDSIESPVKNQNEINLRKLLIGAIQASQKAGQQVMDVSKLENQKVHKKGETKEGVDDLITDADSRSHCLIQTGLLRIFPKLKLVSEEDIPAIKCHEDAKLNIFDLDPTVLSESTIVPDLSVPIEDVSVFIDPLDATKEFTEKLFQYVTIMICVTIKNEPIIGVIHNPFEQKTVWAWSGHALSENLANVKKEEEGGVVKNPVIIVSRSHAGDVKSWARGIFGENIKIVTAAGSGYKILQVINNNATVYIHKTFIKKWDICAGHAIMNALGGTLTTLKNEKITYGVNDKMVIENGILAALNNHHSYASKLN